MLAIAKTRSAPGLDLIEVPEPQVGPGQVKLKVQTGAVCGTDLHIYQWDAWSASRIHPTRIIGHEFCGEIIEVGAGVSADRIGQFVATESHVVALDSEWLAAGLGHVDPDTKILGVDTDGGFAPYAVIPAENARITSRSVPLGVAALQDALGNAVHTALAGPVKDRTILITGMGPIGLMAVAVCRAAGAKRVIATEISTYRTELAYRMGVDEVIDPRQPEVKERIGTVDATLEMSGQPSSLELAISATKPGGRISMLGVYRDAMQSVDLNKVIFRGLALQGIVGRRLWETWEQMAELFENGMDVTPVVTHTMPFTEYETAFALMAAGQAGKIALTFS